MKRSEAFSSPHLYMDDVAQPISATIASVAIEPIKGEFGTEFKPVLRFSGDIKSLVLNPNNWQTLEVAYGEDSDSWRGRAVEIFVDPHVMLGGRRVGGVRVRVPALVRLTNGSMPAVTPLPQEPGLAEYIARAVERMDHAGTLDYLDAWVRWSQALGADESQCHEVDNAYRRNRARLLQAPACGKVGA